MDAMRIAAPSIARAVLVAAPLVAAVSGCSTSRMAVGAMVPVLENARDVALASEDVRTFRDAAPSNLFLLEGLIATDPGNEKLLVNAAMLYFSYAFAFIEDGDPGYASLLYRKGFEHGRAALLRNKKLPRDWDVPFREFAGDLVHLRERDVPAGAWAAANWAQFISLHLDSTAVLRDIPKVTALLERVAALDGAYFEGLPYMMIGSLHAYRPPMMGGDPEASRENFERAFAASENGFLLGRYLHARFYLYRIQDGDAFAAALEDVIATPDRAGDPYRMLNLIAREKAARVLGDSDDLF
jgi:hypothetical protein